MKIEAVALDGIHEIEPGDDLVDAIVGSSESIGDGDIVVVAQKIVSKSEGRFRELSAVEPSDRARELASQTEKDPAMVQLILDESRSVLRAVPGVLIVETNHGFVCANAGIDTSNVVGDRVLLLPIDPDAAARGIRDGLRARLGIAPGVIITDSFGRAWRSGQADVAIGCAGIEPLLDLRGSADSNGRELAATVTAVADEIAAAADLARAKSSGHPVVIVRGRGDLVQDSDGRGAVAGLRERSQDLFR